MAQDAVHAGTENFAVRATYSAGLVQDPPLEPYRMYQTVSVTASLKHDPDRAAGSTSHSDPPY